MNFLYINREKLINRECIFINEITEDIRNIIKENKKRVFLYKNNNVSMVNLSNKNDIELLPCNLINYSFNVNNLLNILSKETVIVVQNEKSELIGYIDLIEFNRNVWEEYRYTKSYLETILETIDESCSVINQDAEVKFWTKGAEKIFSVKKEDILNNPITQFFNTENLEILNALKKGSSVYQMQHQARRDMIVLINSNPIYLEDKVIGAVVSETDITRQVHLNNELYHASEKLFYLEQEKSKDNPFQYIRGNSNEIIHAMDMVKKAAMTDANILIYGESGVGKELFAKAVHHLRESEEAPFIAINCGAIPTALFESEIFGYEKGAFSGADNNGKKGKVELARNGTLFLDEIGEMPLDMQVKILRLLQEKRFFPVGGTKEIEVDFRVVAATNKDLKKLVDEGKFREDLYYRLNVVSIEIPPLRKRLEDIVELTHYFLFEISSRYNRTIKQIPQEVMRILLQHNWPGNIRELKNTLERLIVFSENGMINVDDLPLEIIGNANLIRNNDNNPVETFEEDKGLNTRLQELEKKIIIKELNKVNGNKLQCAKNLQITRATLYNRMNKLNINL